MIYAFPEQPDARTPTRRPSPLPRFSMNLRTRSAAAWVMVIAISVTFSVLPGQNVSGGVGLRAFAGCLGLVIRNRRLDSVLGQHRAVDFHRRQRELLGNLGVLDLARLLDGLALDPLGQQRARGDGTAATVGLELSVLDDALLVDLDLQFHDVAAGGRADHAGAHVRVTLVQHAHVARILVMVQYLVTVYHGCVS